MHELYELKEKLMKELTEFSENGKFSKENIETIKYLSSAIDHLCNIIMDMEEEYSMEGGGGQSSYRRGQSSYARGGQGGGQSSYERGGQSSYARGGNRGGGQSSYARGRGRNARRDSMGRYSSEGGYSMNDEMIAELYEIMEEAPDEKTRKEFEKFIKKVEMM